MSLLEDGDANPKAPEDSLPDLTRRLAEAEAALDRLSSSPSRACEDSASDTHALLDSVRTVLRDAREALAWRMQPPAGPLTNSDPKTVALQAPTVSDAVRTRVGQASQVDAMASRLLQQLLEVMPVGVIVSDAEGALLMTNLLGEAILGGRVSGSAFNLTGSYTAYYTDGTPLSPTQIPLARALRQGDVTRDMELMIRRADGAEWILLVGAAPVRDLDRRIVAGVVVFQDITELKRSQADVTFRARALDQIADVVVAIDNDLRVTYQNQAAADLSGVDPTDALGRDLADLWRYEWPDDAAKQMAYDRLREEGVWQDEALLVTRDGRRIAMESTVTALLDDGGKERGLLAVMRDISERKRAEEAIRASEEEFRAIFESSALGIAIADARSGRFVRVNRKLCEMSGYAEDELVGMAFVEVTHPDDRSYADFEAALRGETDQWTSTRRYARKDGNWFWAEASGTIIRDAAGVPVRSMATLRDVTERRRVDEELRVALEKYRVLFDAFPLGITVSDRSGQIVESNQEAERLLGISRQEHLQRQLSGTEWHIVGPDGTLMPGEEYPSVRALREGRPVRSVEMGIVKEDGATTWIEVTAAPIPLEGYGVAIVYGDVTERKRTADALRDSEARYRELYDTSRDGLVFTDLEGRYIGCNRAYLDLLGYETVEDLRGRSYKELTPPEYHEMEARTVQEQTLVRGYCDAYEKEYIRRSGERISVNLRAWLRRDARGEPSGMWAIVRDISERKRAEERAGASAVREPPTA